MDIRVTNQAVENVACDALVVGAAHTKAEQKSKGIVLSASAQAVDRSLGGLINEICANGEFKGNLGELVTIHTMGKLTAKRVVLVGLGAQETVKPLALRRATATAARHLQHTGAQQIALALLWQGLKDTGIDEAAQAQIEGALLGLYSFKKYQHSDTNGNRQGVTKIKLLSGSADQAALNTAIERGTAFAEATNFARDLVNEPPNV